MRRRLGERKNPKMKSEKEQGTLDEAYEQSGVERSVRAGNEHGAISNRPEWELIGRPLETVLSNNGKKTAQ
jgi:hypothetical protein